MDETLQAIDLTMPAVPTEMERQPPTDSSDKPPTPESAFLQLPAELRISIYEHVFADSHLLVRKGMGEDRDRKEYYPHLVLLRGTPQLLLVCRTTFHEGLPIFWSEALLHAGLLDTVILEDPNLSARVNLDSDVRPAASCEVIWAIPKRSRPLVRHLRNLTSARAPCSGFGSGLGSDLSKLSGLLTCEFHPCGLLWSIRKPTRPVWGYPILSASELNHLSPETFWELVWPKEQLGSLRAYLVSQGLSNEMTQSCTFLVRFGMSPGPVPAEYEKLVFINLNADKIIVQHEAVNVYPLKRNEIEENYRKLLETQ
ncbi:hypothetical protein PG995_003364 [Apiospora arundinis]